MLTSSSFDSIPFIRHGFFTKRGGVSQGLYTSLNVGYGSDDAEENVTENRRLALEALGLPEARLVTGYQVHSNKVKIVTRAWESHKDAPEVDALVTRRPNLALGILTADCVPVLFVDPQAKVIGAAHAGWKGAIAGVCENTISAMESLGADRVCIRAAIGPAIEQASYEVSPDFAMRFFDQSDDNSRFFLPAAREGKLLFDVKGYVKGRLEESGIGSISLSRHDTYREAEHFFSYRRSCHRGEDDCGRGLSSIALTEETDAQ